MTMKSELSSVLCFWLLACVPAVAVPACRKTSADEDSGQIGAAVGEVMSSIDESAQGGVVTALAPERSRRPTGLPPMLRVPDELRGPAWRRAADVVFPSAYAAGVCSDIAFSACDAGMRSRAFTDCSLGLATLNGNVALAFSNTPLCGVAAVGDAVTRTADFTLTGLYGGTLTVSSQGAGQTLTKTATGFEYVVGGMERLLKGPGGRTLFDVSTRTTTPIEITGTSRANLVIVSGALEVTHHLAGYKVTLTPSNLAWAGHCSCAESGTLTGTISGGAHDGKSATVKITGCGEADVTIGAQTDSILLDRCVAI
jgi:hypothetical protein